MDEVESDAVAAAVSSLSGVDLAQMLAAVGDMTDLGRV
jgi:hypothetical protein